jgi:tetratricopeptide (TPR) repeat protein
MLSIQQPQSEVTWGAISELNLKLGRFEDADRALQRYLQVSPDNPNVYLLLGEQMFLQRRYEEARQRYAIALERNPTFAAASIRSAHVDVLTGNAEAAVARLRQVAEDDRFSASDRLTATFDLVDLLRAQERCNEAEALLAHQSELIRREGVRSALALAQRSRCALDAGRVAEARELAAQAVAQSPGPPTRYLVARGLAEIEARDFAAVDETIAALRKLAGSAESGPADVGAAAEFMNGARAMASGEAQPAVAALLAASAKEGYAYELYGLWQARALLLTGDREAARTALTEAAATPDPADPRLDLEHSRSAARVLRARIEGGTLAP